VNQEPSLPPRGQARKGAAAAKPSKPKPRKPPGGKRKKKSPLWVIILTIILGLLILAGLALGYVLLKADSTFNSISIADDIADAPVTPVPVEESVKEKPVSIVLMGVDTRPKGGSLNTDVMMVASFDPKTKTAAVVSMPRDSYINVDGYRARKANQFYADFYVSAIRDGATKEQAEAEGKKAVREVLGKLYGIDVQYAAVINFQGFADVVDALGGVEVDVDMRMKYYSKADGTNIDLHKGRQPLNGEQALGFVRYRQSNDGSNPSSDFDRNRRQTEVVGAIVDKLMTLGGAAKIGSVLDAVGDNVKADMPAGEMRRMLSTYFGVRSDDITFMSVKGSWKSPFVYLEEASLAEARELLQSKMAVKP